MTAQDICQAIIKGEIPASDFPVIQQAIRVYTDTNRPHVRIGDKVKIVGNISPQYMIGVCGKVTKVNSKTYKIRLLEGRGRFRMDHVVKVPISAVVKES